MKPKEILIILFLLDNSKDLPPRFMKKPQLSGNLDEVRLSFLLLRFLPPVF